jgi:hypothetical protein
MCILKLKGCILSFRSPPSKCNHWLDLEVLWPQNEALYIMLLESKVKDDDNNNKRCKNTTICLLLVFSLLN